MSPFKKFYEDTTMPYGNRFVAGIASRELKSNPMSLSTLFTKDQQDMNKARANNVFPHELQNISDTIGDIALTIDNLDSAYDNALNNPNIKNKNNLKDALKVVNGLKNNINTLIAITKKVLDNK